MLCARMHKCVFMYFFFCLFSGVDYIPLSISGVFSPVDADIQQLSFSVDIIDDMLVESTENLFFSLSSDDLAVIVNGNADQVDMAILDNDGTVGAGVENIILHVRQKLT